MESLYFYFILLLETNYYACPTFEGRELYKITYIRE